MIATPEQQSDPLWRTVTKGLPDDPNLALHLAQAWGLVGPHHNIWMDRAGYDAGDAWSQSLTDECEALIARAASAELPESPYAFISIDNATTRDIDDAFAIEKRPDGGWKLIVALAVPALFWPFDEPLDMAVRARSTSIYLPEGTSHMMPQTLGVGALSLFAGTPRPALIVTCEIAADGRLLSCVPEAARINVRANLNYADVEAAFDGADTPAASYLPQLETALELGRTRQAYRVNNGAIIIERPELIITLLGDLTERHIRLDVAPEEDLPRAHLVVAEQMIVANAGLATWAHERRIPLVFRSQDSKVTDNLAGIWSDPVQVATVVRQLAPAVMDTEPRPHIGVGEAIYAPVTSPLRRYPDLINEAQILSYVTDGKPRWDKESLDRLLTYVNTRLDAATMVQRLRLRYWKLLYLLIHGDTWWNGIVTDVNDSFVTVNMTREQVIVRGRKQTFPENVRTGQHVLVRLGKINPLLGDIMLLEAREENAGQPA